MDRSMMDRTANVSWTDILGALRQSVRKAVLDASREAIGTRNAKGDEVKVFDLAAEDAALAVLRELQPPILVDSEECGRQEIGPGRPRHRLVLDPVDGSDNWARALGAGARGSRSRACGASQTP